MELCDAGRHDTTLFRMPHHGIAEIFLPADFAALTAHNTENVFSPARQIGVAPLSTASQCANWPMSAILDNLSQMAGRHDTAGPFTILRVVEN